MIPRNMKNVPVLEGPVVRAFEPRPGANGNWHCRGRLENGPHVRRSRHVGATRQCGARLDPGQRFCGKCGGLVAWTGTVVYNGQTLKHLERTARVAMESC